MTDRTQAMDNLIAQDADLIDLPAMTDVETIAEGLTENMRLALSYAKWANDGSWIKYSDTNRTTYSLRKRGIVERDSNGPLNRTRRGPD